MPSRKSLRSFLLASACCAVSSAVAPAAVKLPSVLASHMVVQRDRPVRVWGWADPGEHVALAFRGETRETQSSDDGRWSVFFSPGPAGGPFQLTVRASNEIALEDILAGDVWLASGQSNMEFPLARANDGANAVASANAPDIRLFHVEHQVSGYPLAAAPARTWAKCDPASVAGFSAVAYYFASDLHQRLAVPIGLIEADWGGTPADAWTSLTALSSDASLMPVFSSWARMMQDQQSTIARSERETAKWREDVAQAKAASKRPPDRPWSPNQDNCWMPSGLYNGMIAPFTPFAIRGVIWYQGESNASRERAPTYARLFQTMIQDWRRAWGEGDFPFLFVQLANFKAGADNAWPELRQAQLETLTLANTGMAVTIDIGNPTNIHPTDKKDVGLRLALAARAIAYGETVEFSGPLFREAAPENHALRVWFSHAGALAAKGGALTGFEVAGADRKFHPAEARIDGAAVVVSSPDVPNPRFVRYGWADNPDCNLYNNAGLPASPFTSS